MALALTDTQHYSDIADAIRAKAGGEDTYLPSEMAQAIEDLPSGGGNPYPVRNDGKTHLWIEIEDLAQPTVSVEFKQSVSNGVAVDWGDGSAVETYAGTSDATHAHTYSTTGVYEITFDVLNGTLSVGQSGGNLNIMGVQPWSTYAYKNAYACARPRAFEADKDTTMSYNALQGCIGLQSVIFQGAGLGNINTYVCYDCHLLSTVTLPEGLTTIPSNSFNKCYSLATVTIPSTVTSIDDSAFRDCVGLTSIVFPANLTNIGAYSFCCCYSLAAATIPEEVTNIGQQAFNNTSLAELHVLPTTPPTLGTNALYGTSTNLVIYVPKGTLATYKAASGWSTYASRMQEESDGE